MDNANGIATLTLDLILGKLLLLRQRAGRIQAPTHLLDNSKT